MSAPYFIEVDHFQKCKDRQQVAGDTFLSRRMREDGRTLAVLSDGLGSGIKANVLSTLTASMALNYATDFRDIRKSSEIILRTLPVCKVRKISYATFTIVDIDSQGLAKIIEYDNPAYILLRGQSLLPIEKTLIAGRLGRSRNYELKYSTVQLEHGDRLVFYTDGISQAGIGSPEFPLGWGEEAVAEAARIIVHGAPGISARELCKHLVGHAFRHSQMRAVDDMSCAAISYRSPRELLLVSGPPVDASRDAELARAVASFVGSRVICGGTTARIIAQQLGRSLNIDFNPANGYSDLPPASLMEGVDLVTEGIITLSRVAKILESDVPREEVTRSPALTLAEKLLQSDIIHVLAGTTINSAHQDPNVPVDLEIRRNILKKILRLLEEKYLKETRLQFI